MADAPRKRPPTLAEQVDEQFAGLMESLVVAGIGAMVGAMAPGAVGTVREMIHRIRTPDPAPAPPPHPPKPRSRTPKPRRPEIRKNAPKRLPKTRFDPSEPVLDPKTDVIDLVLDPDGVYR